MDVVAQALLHKSGENLQFMREDIDKALSMIKISNNLISHF